MLLPTSPNNLPNVFAIDGRFWAENEEVLAKRFEQWLTS
jgi:hypothetical protein